MNSFKTILVVVALIVLGGLGVLYWATFANPQGNTDTGMVFDIQEELAVTEELDPGTYLVFQNIQREKEWLTRRQGQNETHTFYRWKLGDEEPTPFAFVEHPARIAPDLVVEVMGQSLALQNYQEARQGARIALDGEIVQAGVSTGMIESPNGLYRAQWQTYRDPDTELDVIIVIQIDSAEVMALIPIEAFEASERYEVTPTAISNDGRYLYASLICGCEFAPSDQWEVNLETGVVRLIVEHQPVNRYRESFVNPQTRNLLLLEAETGYFEDGPGYFPVAPATVTIKNLETGEEVLVVQDEDHGWTGPRLDPTGKDRFMATLVSESDTWEKYLFTFDGHMTFLTDGLVEGWAGEYVIIDTQEFDETNPYQKAYILQHIETEEQRAFPELPGETRYIGSITIE